MLDNKEKKKLRKKFVTNLALLLALNLLIKPFWIFGIDRTVQNTVGAGEYGLYLALFNWALIFNIILDIGITNYNNKNIAQNHQLVSKHLSNIVTIKFLLSVVYAVIVLTTALMWGWHGKKIYLLSLLILNQFLSSFILYLRSNISGLHLFKTDSIISVLDRLLMIIIVGYLLLNPYTKANFKIEWFVYSQTIAYITTLIITFIVLFRKLDFFKLRFDRKFFIAFFKQSYPYALLVLLMSVYNRIEPILLERLLPDAKSGIEITHTGAYQAGIYAQAFRILDAASMFGLLFAGLLLPMFAKMIKQKSEIGQLLQLSFSLIIVPAIILAGASFFYSKEIMDLLYPEHTEISSTLLGLLMIGFVFVSTTYIFGTLLTANGSLKQLNIMALIGMIANIALNLYLIPTFMSLGSAYASLSTQLLTAVLQVVIAQHIFKFKINYSFLFKFVGFVVGVVILGYGFKTYSTSWVFGISLFIFSSTLFAVTIRLISIKALIHIIKNDEE